MFNFITILTTATEERNEKQERGKEFSSNDNTKSKDDMEPAERLTCEKIMWVSEQKLTESLAVKKEEGDIAYFTILLCSHKDVRRKAGLHHCQVSY